MVGRTLDWNEELGCWLKLFVDRLGHRARRRMCPLYVSGLIGPGAFHSITSSAIADAERTFRCGAEQGGACRSDAASSRAEGTFGVRLHRHARSCVSPPPQLKRRIISGPEFGPPSAKICTIGKGQQIGW
jgi:hypothetical protein